MRAARAALALALRGGASPDEVEDQLRRALEERGADPPDWAIHLELARDMLGRDGQARGIAEVIKAVEAAGAEARPRSAEAALELLDSREASRLGPALTDEHLDRIRALAQGGVDEVRRLAARFAYLRGDTEMAGAMLAGVPVVGGAPAWLASARLVGDAHRAIHDGEPERALAVIDARPDLANDPVVVAARALAHYAEGDPDAAIRAAAGAPLTYDAAVVRTLAHLLTASRGMIGERGAAIDEAASAAADAARLDPTVGDSLFLRAEVMLEGVRGLDEGRRLLTSAWSHVADDRRPVWWEAQRRLRHDDEIFCYFLLEIDRVRGDWVRLGRAAARLTLGATEYAHDGAVNELRAEALEHEGGSPEEVVAAWRHAGSAFDAAGDLLRARACMRRARDRPGAPFEPEAVLELVDLTWRATYAEDDDAATAAALSALKDLDALRPGISSALTARAGYLRGLVYARLRDLPSARGWQPRWEPLPWLLAAAEIDRRDSYRAAHVAWALNHVDLQSAARAYAARAISLRPYDQWLRETHIVMEINWLGRLDAPAREILGPATEADDPWIRTILVWERVLAGDLAGARDLLDGELQADTSGTFIRAVLLALTGDAAAAESLLRGMLEDMSDLAETSSLIECALMVSEPGRARKLLEEGREAGMITPLDSELDAALIDLATGIPTAAAAAQAALEKIVCPRSLRQKVRTLLPTMALVAERPNIAEKCRQIARAAETRLESLPEQVSMTAELAGGVAPIVPQNLVSLVDVLLHVVERRDEGDVASARDMVRSLAEGCTDPRLRQMLEVLEESLPETALDDRGIAG